MATHKNKPRYLIGSLFEEEEHGKKMNFASQKARD